MDGDSEVHLHSGVSAGRRICLRCFGRASVMGTLSVSLNRYSPAWCCFMVGFCTVATGLFWLCFVAGEALAMRLMAFGGGQ